MLRRSFRTLPTISKRRQRSNFDGTTKPLRNRLKPVEHKRGLSSLSQSEASPSLMRIYLKSLRMRAVVAPTRIPSPRQNPLILSLQRHCPSKRLEINLRSLT